MHTEIDLTDEVFDINDDDNPSICMEEPEAYEGDTRVLILGPLRIVMTTEQEDMLRFFYENT